MKKKKIYDGFIIFLMVIIIFCLIGSAALSLNRYKGKTKDYRTPMGWALEEAKKDFLSIRNSDDIYIYEIKEVSVGNFNHKEEPDYYGEYFKMFYVKFTTEDMNVKEYYVAITYNLDKSFWANVPRAFGGNREVIGLEHIVWVDEDEI